MLEKLTETFSGVVRRFSGNARISEKNIREAVEEIKTALLEADVNLRVVRRLVNHTIEEALGESVLKSVNPGQQFVKIIHDRIVALLGDAAAGLNLRGPDVVSVILMTGLQGSGKTTTAAKLAGRLKGEGRRVLMAAADLTRPAAADQLEILGKQLGVAVYREQNSRPEKVARQALKLAKKEQYNVLIVDTAGRMQVDADLMKEIARIKEAVGGDEILLAADAMTGQNAVEIAKSFDEVLNLTGIILSKFDSDARGGAALSIKSIIGKPIKFIGTGEKITDLEVFHPERIASRILGMGDVVSLVEKAQEVIDAEDAEKLQAKIIKATFTLEDYLVQIGQMKKMGTMKSILDMMPGMAIDESKIDDSRLAKEEAIIQSMTLSERRNHYIIGLPRRKRIANGSGTSIAEVGKLLKNFDKSRNMMKKMAKNKKMQQSFMENMAGSSMM
ncbi:MAG: signal recognition particle protein [Spirochaeta sp. LUC14_002_19_P3]|nr:MAG: signal recognition particle protein [Spirochaeta sp. LUC14_002_19_P3]